MCKSSCLQTQPRSIVERSCALQAMDPKAATQRIQHMWDGIASAQISLVQVGACNCVRVSAGPHATVLHDGAC